MALVHFWALPVLALLCHADPDFEAATQESSVSQPRGPHARGNVGSPSQTECHAEPAHPDCEAAALESSVNLLQAKLNSVPPAEHYWPHARGNVGSLSQTKFGWPQEKLSDLNASLAWKWTHPANLSAFVWGSLIDKDGNIIIPTRQGIYKYSPGGERLWAREDVLDSQMPVLMGEALCGMTALHAEMYCLDLETGNHLWQRKAASITGFNGDLVEGHNGVLVAAVELGGEIMSYGAKALKAIAVNASTGAELWSYTPSCGIWNIMALFPTEDTTIFMDSCGGLRRLNLFSGSLVWEHEGSNGSWTDGGPTLGPDGNVYTCSNGPDSLPTILNKNSRAGRLRKYNVNDGTLMWETVLNNPCLNFPSVSPDGQTIVLADGANVLDPPMKWVHGKSDAVIEEEWAFQQKLLQEKKQLQHYGHDNLEASILGFDTHNGAMKWKHDVEPWYGMSFVLDEERAYLWDKGQHPFGHCGPPHWGGITIDQNGKVYVARSDGKLYIYDPAKDTAVTFTTGDGALMTGVSFAPELMVVPTCSWVYVFRQGQLAPCHGVSG